MITNVKAGRYEHVTLFGQPALFTDERIARDAVPDGWYCYDLRGRDDDPMVPATVEKKAAINFAGSVLCPAPLDLGEDGYRELSDEPEDGVDFYGEEISFEDFRKAHGLTVPETEQKPRKHEVEHEPDNAFERLFTIGSMYLHVQRSDEGFDYTLYDRETKREIDGGQLDYDVPLLWDAALEICRLHELGNITTIQTADIAILDELLDEEDRGLKDNRARRYALYPAIDRNARFYYGADKELEFRRGCIGLVHMDVAPDSHKFWHCWFPRGPQEWNTLEFNRELGEVITALRQDVLKSLGRLYLSVNAEQLFQENRILLNSVPNVLDDLRETAEQAERLSWQEIRHAAAFLETQFYSFSSTGQSYGIAPRDITARLPRLIAAYKRLRNAVILHRDYKDAIRYAAGPETFIFLDPPYRGTEDCYPKGDFSTDEHAELFRFLHDLHRTYGGRCRFLVTYNNDPYIRALAEQHGFQASVVSRLDNMRQCKGGGTQYEELLITNYDQQEQAAKNRQVVSMEQAQFSLF